MLEECVVFGIMVEVIIILLLLLLLLRAVASGRDRSGNGNNRRKKLGVLINDWTTVLSVLYFYRNFGLLIVV
jgi:hypothetical protein